MTNGNSERLGKALGLSRRLLALLVGLLLAVVTVAVGAPSAAAHNAVGPQPQILILTVGGQAAAAPEATGADALPQLRLVSATGVAAEAGEGAATTAGNGTQYADRVRWWRLGAMGALVDPKEPLEMDNPRAELGLPKRNTGQYLTKAQVLDREGVIERQALPLDGNPAGGPEWLFPDPENQLQELWTIALDEPF